MSIKCKLCEVEAIAIQRNFQGYKEGDYYTIMNCPSCHSAFPSNQFINSNIYNYIYTNIDKIPGYNRYYLYYKNIKNHSNPLRFLADSEASYWVIDEILTKDIRNKEDIKILEIGCGLGYLTYSLNKEGYKATGLDISQDAIDNAICNFGNAYIKANILYESSLKKKSYDYIVMTELIEHVEDPEKIIDAACEFLNADGKMIITTPNKDFYLSNIVWQTELPPIHLWWFSEQFFKILGKKLNKRVIFFDFTQWNKIWLDRSRINRKQNIVRNPIINQKNEIIGDKSSTSSSLNKILLYLVSSLRLKPMLRKLAIIYYQLLSKDIHKHNVMCIILENHVE